MLSTFHFDDMMDTQDLQPVVLKQFTSLGGVDKFDQLVL